jgi:malonate transporter and related proteins
VLFGVPIPPIVLTSIGLIGVSTSGVALFVAGTSIAAHQVMFNTEVFANCALKMVAQPALYFVLATIFRVIQPYASEGFLLTLLPSGPVSLLLAVRYKAYISEAGSTLAFTTIALLVTLPVDIYLVGAK